MDFYSDVSDELKKYFLSINPTIDLDKLISPLPPASNDNIKHEAATLIERLITFQMKHIENYKRNVFISNELKHKLSSAPNIRFASVISSIENDFKKGIDVNGRLSRGADNLQANDAMLYDWGLYHFHLGEEKESTKSPYYKRTGVLLIVYIPNLKKNAYIIDITENHDHNNLVFARKRYLEIIDNNWPDILEPYILKEVIPDAVLSDEQRLSLRQKGISCLDYIHGKAIFGLGGGITSAKTSIRARMRADHIFNSLYQKESFYKRIQQNYVPHQIPEYLNYRMLFDQHKLCFNIVEYRPHNPPQIVESLFI